MIRQWSQSPLHPHMVLTRAHHAPQRLRDMDRDLRATMIALVSANDRRLFALGRQATWYTCVPMLQENQQRTTGMQQIACLQQVKEHAAPAT